MYKLKQITFALNNLDIPGNFNLCFYRYLLKGNPKQ